MRIVFLSYTYWPPDFGGELLISVERFESLVERGHQVTVLTSGKPRFVSRETREGISILRSPIIHTSRAGRAIRRIVFVIWVTFHLLRMQTTDVVHFGSMPGFNRLTSSLIGLWFAFVCRRKSFGTVLVHSLAHSDNNSFGFSGIVGRVAKASIGASDAIVSVSPRLQCDAESIFTKTKTILMPCGVRDDIFVPLEEGERNHTRAELGYTADDIVFSFLGSVSYRKGFDLLAKAFSDLSAEYPTWQLLVIGPNTRKQNQNIIETETQGVVTEVSQNRNVRFYGRVDDRYRLAHLLGASDVFVFPSRREGMGIAPLEAMAVSVPPIIAHIPGITDQANIHQVTGLYVNVGDLEALKEAMVRLGTDAELRRQYGKAARYRIEEAFSWQRYIDEWEVLYQSVCSP